MNLQQRVTRTIENVLYLKLLELGYTPDRDVYAGNESGFQDKEAEIRNTKGFCIGLFGHGVSHDRGVKAVPRISILGLGFVEGNVGNDPVPHYIPNTDNSAFLKVNGTPSSSIYRLEVTLVSNKTSQDNFMEAVRFTTLPHRVYLPFYDNPDESFLLTYNFVKQLPDMGTGLIQKTYLYEAIDLFETFVQIDSQGETSFEDTIQVPGSGEIAKIKEIEVIEDSSQLDLIK